MEKMKRPINEKLNSINNELAKCLDGFDDIMVISAISTYLMRVSIKICEGDVDLARCCVISSVVKAFSLFEEVEAGKNQERKKKEEDENKRGKHAE